MAATIVFNPVTLTTNLQIRTISEYDLFVFYTSHAPNRHKAKKTEEIGYA